MSDISINTKPVTQTDCPVIVNETVSVQADVTVIPSVAAGEIESFCVGKPVINPCPKNPCTFKVSQNICVQVPLTFSANATAVPAGIVCGTPAVGTCKAKTDCTQSMGYFLSHPDVTNALILAAGGSIVLGKVGTGKGLSFTVTTTNAGKVLSLNTPSPPAPVSGIFANQYKNLYAELLTANLNVLNGETCFFATESINAANKFLANSPPGGMAGAPAVQTPLAQFNLETAPECTKHCPGE
ncbi:MAG: hypothetical protein PHF87_00680 [Desulfotomaculaceae bacterium]|nr:hypothetical protein [Desulfotomaculaceae bacterium]